jgi:hypothetical protein
LKGRGATRPIRARWQAHAINPTHPSRPSSKHRKQANKEKGKNHHRIAASD